MRVVNVGIRWDLNFIAPIAELLGQPRIPIAMGIFVGAVENNRFFHRGNYILRHTEGTQLRSTYLPPDDRTILQYKLTNNSW